MTASRVATKFVIDIASGPGKYRTFTLYVLNQAKANRLNGCEDK